ncbi:MULTISPECIES: hypothetical protein [unclassified Streptococcus]|uniref:hypothetical protein n=1 Tax=unclassified Streptococcus TaxID=2608887 RepID=UPI0018ABD01E|nr:MULTISPECIES: hypothetical protein [unclassified Streptococcus]MBF8970243.1 hypothetical protein [Streptococcus sp. NLN76]MBG9366847.1 hypothetical protein [Streptococcus sp. NLN64]
MEWTFMGLVLALHLIWASYLTRQGKRGVFHFPGYYVIFAFLLPIFGPLLLSIVHLSQQIELDLKLVEEPVEWDVTTQSKGVDVDPHQNPVLPLETALLLEDGQVARGLLLDLPMEQAKDNLELLYMARQHGDSEVVHYAASVIAGLQEDYERGIRSLRQFYEEAPHEPARLKKYQEALEAYLGSGLLEGQARRAYLLQAGRLAKEQVERSNNYKGHLRLAQIQLDLEDYEAAQAELYHLLSTWSDQEEVWMLLLRYYFELHDAWNFRKALASVREEGIYITHENEAHLRFWEQRLEGRV